MLTNLLRPLAFTALFAAVVFPLSAQDNAGPKIDFPAVSPGSTLKQRVGLTDIEIDYSRPGMKGRQVFGGLVPFGAVWRTGANSATRIVFSTAVKLNGVDVPAGTYGLFTIPDKDEWTIIINQVDKQWGAYQYDASKDLVRFKAQPIALTKPVESFTIDIADLHDESAVLTLAWEKTLVPVKIEVDVVSKLIPQIEAFMKSDAKKNGGVYFASAQFYYLHDHDLNSALNWIDQAIATDSKAFYFYYWKARILAKLGRKDEAIATAKQSIELASGPAKDEYIRLNNEVISGLK